MLVVSSCVLVNSLSPRLIYGRIESTGAKMSVPAPTFGPTRRVIFVPVGRSEAKSRVCIAFASVLIKRDRRKPHKQGDPVCLFYNPRVKVRQLKPDDFGSKGRINPHSQLDAGMSAFLYTTCFTNRDS